MSPFDWQFWRLAYLAPERCEGLTVSGWRRLWPSRGWWWCQR